MKFPSSNFIAVVIMTCIATSIFMVAIERNTTPIVKQTSHRIDLSSYEIPHSNYNSSKRLAPLIRLDDASHLEPLTGLVGGRMLLDFHAIWCGPCKKQSVILEDIAANEDLCNAVMLKIDIDQFPDLARKYNVVTVPKLVVLKKGNVIIEQSGMATKETIVGWLKDDEAIDKLAQANQ